MPQVPRLGRSAEAAKPKVLLVDDHRGMLDRASALLAGDFDVVGVATDGREAVDAVPRLMPDLIVLDINMPGLDGFQTKQALDDTGSRAPVVFLSAVADDDHVTEAFRRGGRGYVLKPRLARDLAGALDQVLTGRLIVPSLTSLLEMGSGGGHAMQLYAEVDGFLDELAAFYDVALRRGDATCVIAGADVRDGLERRLRAAGWNVGGSSGHGRYLAIDALEALGRVMRHGLPDAGRVAEIASELDEYRRAVSEGAAGRLTVFGRVVAPLIAAGNPDGAMLLENQWHRVTQDRPFLTLCAYPASCFHDNAPDLWSKACHEHSAVSHSHDV
jgi:CheY-like chemotaxis protein